MYRERVNNVETMKNLSLVDSMMILRIGGLSPKRVKIHSSCFRRNQDLKFWNIQCAQSIQNNILKWFDQQTHKRKHS